MAAAVIASHYLPFPRPMPKLHSLRRTKHLPSRTGLLRRTTRAVDLDVVIPLQQTADSTDQQDATGGFSFESGGELVGGGGGFNPSPPPPPEGGGGGIGDEEDMGMRVDRAINATIVLAAGTFAITKLLTIDRDYWHKQLVNHVFPKLAVYNSVDLSLAPSLLMGWTIYEILRYAPQHNWSAYEEALKENPVLAKMMISGVVYSVGDWIAQCYEGKPLFDFDRTRAFRSGLVGFTLHGSLSHYYYQFCEVLFPFHDWWVVPAKVVFDQTVWSAVWNSIYYVVLGFLRFETPVNIFNELKVTFVPLLTAGWKLWPFAHLITYGVVPVEQRLLWVDCVELVWVTILSTYSNEKSEARSSEALADPESQSHLIAPEDSTE